MEVGSYLDEASGVFAILGGSSRERCAQEFVADDGIHVMADFVGVAMRIKLGLDVEALGPFPEGFFDLVLGAGFFQGEALLFNGEAFGGEVATAEGGDILAEIAQAAKLEFGIIL